MAEKEITREWEGRKITEEELEKMGWTRGITYDRAIVFNKGKSNLHWYPPTQTIQFVFLH